MTTTQVSRRIGAPRAAVYGALVDGRAIARWRVPDGMTSVVHQFDARPGGTFRITLTYDVATGVGKTTSNSDTFHGHFVRIEPNALVVEVFEFETADPDLEGQVTITTTLVDRDGETDILVLHEGLPPGVAAADNEMGTRMALARLAALVEAS
jgi:uncharacterized protein YndB with AHSA1/START domain